MWDVSEDERELRLTVAAGPVAHASPRIRVPGKNPLPPSRANELGTRPIACSTASRES